MNPTSTLFVQRLVLASSVIGAPILLMAWFTLCPQYGNPSCPTSANTLSALDAFRNADPGLLSIFLTVNTIVPYIYPLSYLGLGMITVKRSPTLSIVGMISGWFGSIAWGFIGAAMFVYADAANLADTTAAVSLLNGIYLHWQIYYVVAFGWVVGHLLGYVLLGIAFWRTRIVPRWAAMLLIASAPIMGPIAYPTGNGWLQVAGYGLVLIGSIPAAVRILNVDSALRNRADAKSSTPDT